MPFIISRSLTGVPDPSGLWSRFATRFLRAGVGHSQSRLNRSRCFAGALSTAELSAEVTARF